MELTLRGQESFNKFAERAEQEAIRYVVVRDHTDLPESVPGGDIDVFAEATRFNDVKQICDEIRLNRHESRVSILFKAACEALRNTDKLFYGLRHPVETLRLLSTGTTSTAHRVLKRDLDGVTLDIRDHLTHRSPMEGDHIYPVAREFEEKLLDRRVKKDFFYIPAPQDELAHLICRTVFDYQEEPIPTYYEQRMKELSEEVFSKKKTRNEFEESMELIFYKAGGLVAKLAEEGRFNEMREELYGFADY